MNGETFSRRSFLSAATGTGAAHSAVGREQRATLPQTTSDGSELDKEVSESWSFRTGPPDIQIHETHVFEDLVFVIDGSGTVLAFERNSGSVRWRKEIDRGIRAEMELSNGVVYVWTDTSLAALAPSSGERLWSTDVSSTDTIATGNDSVYIGTRDGQIHSLATVDGRRQWSTETDGEVKFISVGQDTVCFATFDGSTVGALSTTGERQWSWQAGENKDLDPGTVTRSGSEIYFIVNDTLRARSADTGTALWTFQTGLNIDSLAVGSESVYIGASDFDSDSSAVYSVAVSGGSQRWRTTFDEPLTDVIISGDVVVVAGFDNLYGLARLSGTQEWTHGLEVSTRSTVSSGGLVYYISHPSDSPDFVSAVSANDGTRSWSAQLPDLNKYIISFTSPIIDSEEIYIVDVTGDLHSFTTDGSRRWRYRTGEEVVNVEIFDGNLYAVTNQESLYSFDIENGTQVWQILDYDSISGFRLLDGTVYFKSNDTCHAVATADGSELWNTQFDDTIEAFSVSTGGVYCESGGSVHKLSTTDGETQWSYETDESIGSIRISGEMIYIVRSDNDSSSSVIRALTTETGTEQWNYRVDNALYILEKSNTALYVVEGDNIVTAFESASGDELWSRSYDSDVRSFAHSEDWVYVGLDSGLVTALDSTTGSERWLEFLPPSVYIYPREAHLAESELYLRTASNSLLKLNTADGSIQWEIDHVQILDFNYSNGTIYSGTGGGVVAVTEAGGTELWNYQLNGYILDFEIDGDQICLGVDNRIVSLNETVVQSVSAATGTGTLAPTPTSTPAPTSTARPTPTPTNLLLTGAFLLVSVSALLWMMGGLDDLDQGGESRKHKSDADGSDSGETDNTHNEPSSDVRTKEILPLHNKDPGELTEEDLKTLHDVADPDDNE